MAKEIFGTQFETRDGYTYEVKEGNITRGVGFLLINGAPAETIEFEKAVEPHTFLRFNPSEDLLMEPVPCSTAGNTVIATHINEKRPKWHSGPIPAPEEGGTLQDGNYNRRHVTAYRFETGEMMFPLSPTNVAIKPGDKMEVDATTMGLDKAGTDTTSEVISLETAKANLGGYILVDLRKPEIPVKLCANASSTVATRSVSVSVKDGDDDTISGASVTLTDTTDSSKTYTGTTGSAGGCTISNVPDGSYNVKSEKTGYDDYIGTFTVSSTNTNLNITMTSS